MRYNVYSDFLKSKYGEKVYKLPVNLPTTCPNRDGRISVGGCIFCGENGAGYESLPAAMPVSEQISANRDYIGKKYGAKKFIAYFQNFCNTYMPMSDFENAVEEAAKQGVVGIDVSTRPDCVGDRHLEILSRISKEYGVDISVELGLQSVNCRTLERINRGHGLAEFVDCVLRVKEFGFDVCVHLIPDLPWDSREDVVDAAKILSALRVNSVKLHSLFVVKNTRLAQMYEKGEVKLLGAEEYAQRCVLFLKHLSPDIVIQRIVGRIPEEDSVTANDGMSWW
ncbi:MAG: TIGR01212 family radical SAM protein, partial [Clostridia bacterium]|nr:TIGR01212 family radical SAM protein [Clostridia bacterium]